MRFVVGELVVKWRPPLLLSRWATPAALERVLIRDAGRCGICGKPVHPFDLTFDHVIPRARGGDSSEANLQVAHRRCNTSKGAKPQK